MKSFGLKGKRAMRLLMFRQEARVKRRLRREWDAFGVESWSELCQASGTNSGPGMWTTLVLILPRICQISACSPPTTIKTN